MKKIYLVAAILAIITGVLVFNFANSLEKKAMQKYKEVLVAATVIPARTTITEDMLEIKSIPESAVPSNYFYTKQQAISQISETVIEMGEIISASKIHSAEDKGNNMGYFIPENMRAITISVDAVSGIAGFIMPGDRIDIISLMPLEYEVEDEKVTKSTALVIAQDIEVLASGIVTNASPNLKNLTYSNLTIAVTPKQALEISYATTHGSIRLALRSVTDNENIDYEFVNSDSFIFTD